MQTVVHQTGGLNFIHTLSDIFLNEPAWGCGVCISLDVYTFLAWEVYIWYRLHNISREEVKEM